MTPARGDYTSLPLTPEARKIADGWNPSRDEATGEEYRAYAAPAARRVPGRLRIAWQDDHALKTDAGTQTRVFRDDDPLQERARRRERTSDRV